MPQPLSLFPASGVDACEMSSVVTSTVVAATMTTASTRKLFYLVPFRILIGIGIFMMGM
jgi:hypothetical protein